MDIGRSRIPLSAKSRAVQCQIPSLLHAARVYARRETRTDWPCRFACIRNRSAPADQAPLGIGSHFTNQLCWMELSSKQTTGRLGWLFGIKVEHILHTGDIKYRSLPECTTSCGATARSSSAQTPADRLARQPFMFRPLDHLTRPANRASSASYGLRDGFEQTVATSNAVSLQDSLRAAPGRASSLGARSRLPSTKRRLVSRPWTPQPRYWPRSPRRRSPRRQPAEFALV